MPIISMFYGIIVYMYSEVGERHKLPHVHVIYGENEAVYNFDGDVVKGALPPSKGKLVTAWIELHREDLIANWYLLQSGNKPERVEPLK